MLLREDLKSSHLQMNSIWRSQIEASQKWTLRHVAAILILVSILPEAKIRKLEERRRQIPEIL